LKLPQLFLQRLEQIVPRSSLSGVLSSFEKKRPTTFRLNTLYGKPWELKERLSEEHVIVKPISWLGIAFILQNPTLRELQDTQVYKSGKIYVQSLSSMIPAIALDPKIGEQILDIAAAPGSKTTQVAMMMGNTGRIVANDISPIRIMKLQANLKMQGVTNVTISRKAGQTLWQDYPEQFDRVLVDVPCSMEGRITLTDPKSFGGWSTRKIHELAKEQKWMLRSAVSATRVGGRIVYSTCTIAPEENEEVIDWILEKEKGAVIAEAVSLLGVSVSPAVTEWEGKQYHRQVANAIRILPSATMEGFFIASLRKIRSTVAQTSE
jgi:NOL1/NOP2/sun family putative RNA methylase